MLDFSSAHYLGISHAPDAMPSEPRLTTGRPAALQSPAVQSEIQRSLRTLFKTNHVLVKRSTLHAFVDIYDQIRPAREAILVDAGAYPIQRWAINMAKGRGAVVSQFRHHDVESLARKTAAARRRRLRPFVAVDGFCTGCGKLAPLTDYLDVIHSAGGRLIIDDTQSTGIHGESPGQITPWGHGGGGSQLHAGLGSDQGLIIVTSFAKALAAPIATVAAPAKGLALPGTDVHCSPATNADLAALQSALTINARHGEQLRRRLLGNIRLFRREMGRLGRETSGRLFPVQSVSCPEYQAVAVERFLLAAGIRPILTESSCRHGATVTLIITARHTARQLKFAAHALHQALTKAEIRRRAIAPPGLVARIEYRKRAGSIV